MSLVAIGLSHHSAPLAVLSVLGQPNHDELLHRISVADYVEEAVLLRTCNRLEVYADVSRFHGAVEAIVAVLADSVQLDAHELSGHMYVHFDNAAVEHVFQVACGLDSMAVGEAQILGQLRNALKTARAEGHCGHAVGRLLEHALRVGKRAHTETALDKVAGSLVETALDCAAEHLDLGTARVLVLGAGTMAGLVMTSLVQRATGPISVLSRTTQRAQRLAQSVGATVVPTNDLVSALGQSDVVIATAGAAGHLVTLEELRQAREQSSTSSNVDPNMRPEAAAMACIDIALPADIDPAVAQLPGVHLIDLNRVGQVLAERAEPSDLAAVHSIVAEETSAFVATQMAASVTPTVVALREYAATVVQAELQRMHSKLPDLDEVSARELNATVHRVVDKLLHTPTVRVKQLACERAADSYATVLQDLFNLSVTQTGVGTPGPLKVSDVQVNGGAS